MKLVKFGIFALSMGLFVASCGDNASTETTDADTTTVVTEPAPAPAPMDTTTAMPADTSMMSADTMAH